MTRLFGIRHIRYYYLSLKFWYWWCGFGRHFWLTPSAQDIQYLDDVWRGRR